MDTPEIQNIELDTGSEDNSVKSYRPTATLLVSADCIDVDAPNDQV
jgi:hypothetical protein